MSTIHQRPLPPAAGLTGAADRLGAAASLLCAVHCAALPFLLALLPALGLGFLASHGFERVFIACASALAVTMAVHGYRRHRTAWVFGLLVPGLVLLWLGGFAFDFGSALFWHSIFVVAGGTCVALAHVANLHLSRTQPSCDCVTPA
ncbi:MAG: MerC domain-containing protein [Xanthomonadaceae bacterium]|nr:MerC family mercury resistance protein [Xanthomonadaceae bacterium]MDE1961080.1 MerC domain-containing protein [Xanthomonadaceae bacterium]MDE2084451.1 MerC domain-containing protein [Xanthomonadaceae bacterium]MDE2257303.1 MerC domain-containing protein [Xanthomonadaceae bacterium]